MSLNASGSRPWKVRQFCPAGHDTFVVGRVAGGSCRECHKTRKRAWRTANPEKWRGYYDVWRAKNLDSELARAAARRAKCPKGDMLAVRAAEVSCAYCGGPAEHVEHCTPLSRGGSGGLDNLVMACAACNLSKHDQTVLEFTGLWPKAA